MEENDPIDGGEMIGRAMNELLGQTRVMFGEATAPVRYGYIRVAWDFVNARAAEGWELTAITSGAATRGGEPMHVMQRKLGAADEAEALLGGAQRPVETPAAHPGIRIRVTSPHGPLLDMDSAQLHHLAAMRPANVDQCGPACTPGCEAHGWTDLVPGLIDATGVRTLIKPVMLTEPAEDET